jgi:hypothetical protein
MKVTNIENHFLQKQELLKNLGDDQEFNMVFWLIDHVKELRNEIDKLTVLNRHYYHTFYSGNLEKMEQDFKYLMDQ